MISIHPLPVTGDVEPGADIAGLLVVALRLAALHPHLGDILVVTQKIISKAENRFVNLGEITPGVEAIRLAAITGKDARLVHLILAESTAILRAAPNVLIARHHSGHVMANAGIDRSNLGPGRDGQVLLLPHDCNASAKTLLLALRAVGVTMSGIIISDSFGRPWRLGVVNVALGAAGLATLVDRRGEPDRDGKALEVTQIAFGDAIASAAGLAMGEGAEGVPAALVRGVVMPAGELSAQALIRPFEQDLFQ